MGETTIRTKVEEALRVIPHTFKDFIDTGFGGVYNIIVSTTSDDDGRAVDSGPTVGIGPFCHDGTAAEWLTGGIPSIWVWRVGVDDPEDSVECHTVGEIIGEVELLRTA